MVRRVYFSLQIYMELLYGKIIISETQVLKLMFDKFLLPFRSN